MCLVVGSFLIYVFGFIDDSIDVNLFDMDQAYTTTIYVKDSKTGAYNEYQRLHGSVNRIWVSYDKELAEANDPTYTGIPKKLADAFVAIEDERFFDHSGVDWRRTIKAASNFLVNDSTSFGGSTITQQLIKNTHLSNEKTFNRKLKEIKLAKKLEKTFKKLLHF